MATLLPLQSLSITLSFDVYKLPTLCPRPGAINVRPDTCSTAHAVRNSVTRAHILQLHQVLSQAIHDVRTDSQSPCPASFNSSGERAIPSIFGVRFIADGLKDTYRLL